jgi:hypothetical protein
MNHREQFERRAQLALALKRGGSTFRQIMVLLGLPCPEFARRLVARGEHLEKGSRAPAASAPRPARSHSAAGSPTPRRARSSHPSKPLFQAFPSRPILGRPSNPETSASKPASFQASQAFSACFRLSGSG